MSLPRHGFYPKDEQMVRVKGTESFIYVFEGAWVSRCCWGLPTYSRVAWGPLGTWWQRGSPAGCRGHWQDSTHSWCLKTPRCCKHHLLLAKKYGQGVFLDVEVR